MIFQNNTIKQYLKNVYFITGTPCGGKTTISRELAKKHNMMLYDVDEKFGEHKALTDAENQPAMNKEFMNADEFFMRPYTEYVQWLKNNTREQLEYVILDLIQLSYTQKVVCDLHLTLEEAKILTDPSHIVFLLKDPSNIIEEYCNRPDHDDFKRYINSASDVDFAKANCNKTLEFLNREKYETVKKSHYCWVERTNENTVEKTLKIVETHFEL